MMSRTRGPHAIGLILGLLAGTLLAGGGERQAWTFDDDPIGAIALGFTSEAGRWTGVASDSGRAAGQVGLWSKADARSEFDNLTLVGR